MPPLEIARHQLDISREACLLDTNILVAFFSKDDQWHDDAMAFIDLVSGQLLVPASVAVETWGVLVGSRKLFDAGLLFLGWVNDPGKAVVIPGWDGLLTDAERLSRRLHVDLVDAAVMCVAETVTHECALNPPVMVATFDTGDFLKFYRSKKPNFHVFDVITLEP